MWPAVSYTLYATSFHEQTDDIITLTQLEEIKLVENKHNAEEDEAVLSSID